MNIFRYGLVHLATWKSEADSPVPNNMIGGGGGDGTAVMWLTWILEIYGCESFIDQDGEAASLWNCIM